MSSERRESAIVVRVPIPTALERIRRRWDYAAGVGVPAHVTILYPFLQPNDLRPAVRAELVALAATVEPFDVRFAAIGRFPTVVYLAPEPSGPFAGLTRAVVDRFPDCLPYGGAHDVVIPHLTITESGEAPFDDIALQVGGALPFSHRVGRLEVLIEGGEGRWHGHWRIPLGVKP
jgi:2'-5' RNA ligase